MSSCLQHDCQTLVFSELHAILLTPQSCPFLVLFVLHHRSCVDLMSKSLSNHEKVVRPALIYSLFPNVSPTIYFGTRDERGNCNQGTQSRGTHRRIPANLGGGDKMGELFQNGFFCPRFPQDVGSIVNFTCLSFDLSQSHNLWLSTWPLFGFFLLQPLLCSSLLYSPLSIKGSSLNLI